MSMNLGYHQAGRYAPGAGRWASCLMVVIRSPVILMSAMNQAPARHDPSACDQIERCGCRARFR